jgi:hypothetical protein
MTEQMKTVCKSIQRERPVGSRGYDRVHHMLAREALLENARNIALEAAAVKALQQLGEPVLGDPQKVGWAIETLRGTLTKSPSDDSIG